MERLLSLTVAQHTPFLINGFICLREYFKIKLLLFENNFSIVYNSLVKMKTRLRQF